MSAGMTVPVWRLALADLLHEWRSSIVTVMAVTVALAPLLILFGLRMGVVETLRERLASNPANLELKHMGENARLTDDWFETMRRDPRVGFVSPLPRYVNFAEVTLIHDFGDRERNLSVVSVVPSGPGDPVLGYSGATAPEGEAIVLSARAAEELSVEAGATVTIQITRNLKSGRREAITLPVTVHAVLPPGATPLKTAFAPLHIPVAIEDYREWQRVDRYGWPGQPPIDDPWPSLRLYAATLQDVEPLRREMLERFGLETETASDRIAATERINRDLGRLFAAILALTLAGYAASIGLTQLAQVQKKRKVLAVLRLIGYPPGAIRWFPILQGAGLALVGALAALLVFRLMDPVISALFRDAVDAGGNLTRLAPEHALVALTGSVAIAALASSVAGWRAMQISPAENLRDA